MHLKLHTEIPIKACLIAVIGYKWSSASLHLLYVGGSLPTPSRTFGPRYVASHSIAADRAGVSAGFQLTGLKESGRLGRGCEFENSISTLVNLCSKFRLHWIAETWHEPGHREP